MAHAKPGEDNHWACACDAQWLHLALQPLAQNGRMPQRLVPDFAPVLPGRPESVFLTGPQDAATLIWCRPQGVLWSPLPCPWPLLQATPVVAQVEPGAAQLLATLSGHLEQATVHSQTRAERWLQATALPWDLATGTWSQTPLQRFWRQVQSLARALWHDPSWKPARVALLGLVLAQGLGLNAWSWFMGQELLNQKQALNALLTQTFPQTQLVVDAPLQMKQALQRLQQQVGAAHPGQPEVMLHQLSQVEALTAPIRSIRYDGRALTIKTDGALNMAPAQQQRLRQLGYALHIQPEGLTMAYEGKP